MKDCANMRAVDVINQVSLKPSRHEMHLARRVFHMASGLAIAVASFFLESKQAFVLALSVAALIDLVIEGLRLVYMPFNRLIEKLFGDLMRDGEQRQLSGIAYYLIGCTVAALIFPRVIAVLAILFLAFGDPIAALVGLRFGKRPFPSPLQVPQKSIEGSVACFVVCSGITFAIVDFFPKTEHLQLMDRFMFAGLGGLSAVLGEFMPLRTDDNLALPLVAGSFLWLTATAFNLIPGLYF